VYHKQVNTYHPTSVGRTNHAKTSRYHLQDETLGRTQSAGLQETKGKVQMAANDSVSIAHFQSNAQLPVRYFGCTLSLQTYHIKSNQIQSKTRV